MLGQGEYRTDSDSPEFRESYQVVAVVLATVLAVVVAILMIGSYDTAPTAGAPVNLFHTASFHLQPGVGRDTPGAGQLFPDSSSPGRGTTPCLDNGPRPGPLIGEITP